MRLTAPKKSTFWISIIFAIIAVISSIIVIPFLSTYSFVILLIGFILLALGIFIKGF